MKPLIIVLLLILWTGTAIGYSSAMASEPAESVTMTTNPVTDTGPEAKKEKELTLPPGFREKKYGKHVLYCKKEAQMGTRVKTETCFDEQQMRDYLLALETNKVDIDRVRAICSNPCVCGMPC